MNRLSGICISIFTLLLVIIFFIFMVEEYLLDKLLGKNWGSK